MYLNQSSKPYQTHALEAAERQQCIRCVLYCGGLDIEDNKSAHRHPLCDMGQCSVGKPYPGGLSENQIFAFLSM